MRLTAAFLINIWIASGQVPASAPVPPDPYELVTGKTVAKPMDRIEGLALLNKAKRPMRLLAPMTPHYLMTVSFTATGDPANSGPGELTELWLGAQNWRWTANLGNFALSRIGTKLGTYDEKLVQLVPMRVHMLRNTIFWAAQGVTASSQFRSAAVEWNGRPATCLLLSDHAEAGEAPKARRWDESEYCIDDQTGLLQILSVAPGSYVVYSYSGQSFHGQPMPDRIRTYIAGNLVIDASFRMDEPNVADGTTLTATPEATAGPPIVTLDEPLFLREDLPNTSVSSAALPVIVNAQIGPGGKVVVAELCAAADPALGATALNFVKNNMFPQGNVQRQAYVQVRFIPKGVVPAQVTEAKPATVATEPYYLERVVSIPDRPANMTDKKEILARRSDGATLRMSTVGVGGQEVYLRELKFPDGRSLTVYDGVKAKTTWPPLNAFEKSMLSSRNFVPADCYANAGGAKLLRRDEMEGQQVVVTVQTAGSFRVTSWAAPQLACESLYTNVEAVKQDGSFRQSAETKTTRLVVGEPDPRLFDVDADLVEMKPSEAQRRLWESLDLGLSADQKAAMVREIQREGADMDKRYQTKGQQE